jgi:hypothetical protein
MTDDQAKKIAAEFPYFSVAKGKPGENYGDQPAEAGDGADRHRHQHYRRAAGGRGL